MSQDDFRNEEAFVHGHAGLGTITVGEVRAEAVRVAQNSTLTGDLVTQLHRRLQSVLRPQETEGACHRAFEKHSELARLLHSTAISQDDTIGALQDLLARLEL
jgi:hypothetical protein